MYIKNIIAILLTGIISAGVLFAQNTQSEKLKVESSLATPVPGAKISSLGDSLNMISPMIDRQVNLPFGQSTARFTAGDITVINPDELINYDNTSITSVLSGRVPGLYSGTNLRGLGNAVIIIDGIPRLISEINLSEVEQITVLNDANAGMLYGVQANNGVILIKTKRGKPNVNKITALVETGLANPISYPKYLRSADYMELYNEALVNDGLTPLYSDAVITGTRDGTNPTRYPDADYFNSTFLKSQKTNSRVETGFSGGNKNAQYYANLGWQRSGSLLNLGEQPHNNRLNIRSNLDFRITDFINSHIDIAAVVNINRTPNSNFFSDVTTLKPNYFPLLIDTSLVGDKKLTKTARKVEGKYILGGTSIYKNNVYGNLLLAGNTKQFNSTTMFNAGIDFDLNSILKGLTLKTSASFDFYNQYDETQTNAYAIYEPKWVIGKALQDSLVVTKTGADQFAGAQGIGNTNLWKDYTVYGNLDYSNMFGENHALSATILAYFDQYNIIGVFQQDKHMHLGARINYVYKNKYIVNFTSALVSSPKLAPANRAAFSPSVALAWIISEEDFLKSISVIDYLKLSLSTGIINTDMNLTRYFTYDNLWVASPYYVWGEGLRGASGSVLTNPANPYLSYEKRKEITIGTEAGLFDNSIWVDANFFIDRKTNMIVLYGLSNTYPSFMGSLNPAENHDENKNTGFELGVSWKKSISNFSIDIGYSMLILKSTAVKRDEFYGYNYLYRAGKSTGAIFGLESLGLFQDDAEIASSPTQLFGAVQPGDIKYKDQNGDGYIDSNDQIMIGDGLSRVVGGLTLKMTYKNLTLFALATARNGAQTYFSSSYYWVNGDVKYSENALNRWTSSTASTATYPRLSSKANSNNYQVSTYWLEKNSMISLNRVQLTYDLPGSLSTKLFTKDISVYLMASNIFNIAQNRDKMELSIGSEPQYRYYSIGLKAMF